MPTRRDALRLLAATAATAAGGGLAPRIAFAGAPSQQRRIPKIGIQLYTVRSALKNDVERTLARLAGIGYREVEFAGYFDVPATQLRAMLDRHGLSAPAAHVDHGALRAAPDRVFDDALALGHRWVIVAWLPPREHGTLDAWARRADEFNRFGALAKARGMRFAYHNQEFDFTPLDGGNGMDTLLARTDAALVDFELDLFWIAKAGHDPIAYLRKANGRVPMVHVKDMDASPQKRMVDVGAGILPFTRIFAEGEKLGLRHFFVEHDEPGDPFASANASFRHLDALRW